MEIVHKKSTGYYLAIPMVDSSAPASFKTGLSPTDTAYYKDGAGAWTSLPISDSFAEIGSTGVYELNIGSGEISTHDFIFIKVTASGAADTFVLFKMTTQNVDDLPTAAEVNTEVDTALAELHLDHLLKNAWAGDPTITTIFDRILNKDGSQTFDPTTDSLEAIRDRGDSAWTAGGAAPTVEEIRAEMDANSTQFAAIVTDTGELQTDWADGGRLDLLIDEILADTGTTLPTQLDSMSGATFDSATDSLEAIRNRGDVAWLTGGGGSGANQVTLTIEEADTTPIPYVRVSVLNSDSTVVIATGTADVNGQAVFALDDGTYKILLSRVGVTFTVPETLVVDETPETATFNGTVVAVGDPPVADLCRMYEYCMDQEGNPLTSVTNYAAITDMPFDDGDGAFQTTKVEGTYSAVTGLLYWDIVQGAKVLIEIEEIGMHKKYTVPAQANARLGDLTPL